MSNSTATGRSGVLVIVPGNNSAVLCTVLPSSSQEAALPLNSAKSVTASSKLDEGSKKLAAV